MSNTNEKDGAPQQPAGNIESFAWSKAENLYALFAKLWTPVQLFLAVGGLVMALYFGNGLRLSLLNSQHSIAKALEAKLEPTRNADQGIAAYLLSNVKGDWTDAKYLNVDEINSILEEINKKLIELAPKESKLIGGSTRSKTNAPTTAVSTAAPLDALEVIRKLKLQITNSGSTESWRTRITSMRKESFLVVPAMSLRRKSLTEPPFNANDELALSGVLKYNPEILFDLNLASEIEPIMRRMDGASGKELTIVQAYFITESGVFLIRKPGVKDHSNYYGKEFKPYMQYMDRPYFWGAVDDEQRTVTPTPFDYATKPYLDLGGNGFVVTFSKRFYLPNQRVGVLCIDAKLPESTTDEIAAYLKSLGARVSDFYWSEKNGAEPPLPPEFSWFIDELNKNEGAKSEVLGTITTEPPSLSQTQGGDEAGRVVRFTVPIGSSQYGEGNKKTRLLLVEFDSGRILRTLTWNLVFFAVGIALVIAVTWSLFRDYTVLKREMSNVLEKMSKVMRDASTPFAWLNERNEFHKVNNSLLKVLGYDNIEDLKRQTPTFRGLVRDETQPTYDAILETSRAGEETGEYEIDVITKEDKILHVRAHGERIPYPTFWRRGLPHRFGIFVEVTGPTPAAKPKLVSDRGESAKAHSR